MMFFVSNILKLKNVNKEFIKESRSTNTSLRGFGISLCYLDLWRDDIILSQGIDAKPFRCILD